MREAADPPRQPCSALGPGSAVACAPAQLALSAAQPVTSGRWGRTCPMTGAGMCRGRRSPPRHALRISLCRVLAPSP